MVPLRPKNGSHFFNLQKRVSVDGTADLSGRDFQPLCHDTLDLKYIDQPSRCLGMELDSKNL